jgi:hypothetical protein
MQKLDKNLFLLFYLFSFFRLKSMNFLTFEAFANSIIVIFSYFFGSYLFEQFSNSAFVFGNPTAKYNDHTYLAPENPNHAFKETVNYVFLMFLFSFLSFIMVLLGFAFNL